MKVVILAGGKGTRISEETLVRPKPMIEIGGKPILWHIMKHYSFYGMNEFIICLGYKSYMIKEYFANYFLHMSDVTFDLAKNHMEVHQNYGESWKVTLVDTGEETMTGGRLKRIGRVLPPGEDFCMTYGDGVSNVNLTRLIEEHKKNKKLATLTAIQPAGRFGALTITDNLVTSFMEKPQGDGHWINGGFFVLAPEVLDLIKDDTTVWEKEPLEQLALQNQLQVYKHGGFWYALDSLRDKNHLEALWSDGKPPWRTW